MFSVCVDEEKVVERAFRAYFRRYGKDALQPSQYGSELTSKGIVELVNCNGVLARYRYDEKNDRLHFIE